MERNDESEKDGVCGKRRGGEGGKLRDSGRKIEGNRERERVKKEGWKGGQRASGVVSPRFRDYSPAEDHREDYTPAAVARINPYPHSAHRSTSRTAPKRKG